MNVWFAPVLTVAFAGATVTEIACTTPSGYASDTTDCDDTQALVNPGALEEKSGLLSAGFTWVSGDLMLDVGIMHRNLARDGFAHSADDRIVGSVRFAF